MCQPFHVDADRATPSARLAGDGDRAAVDRLHERVWGGPIVVGHGRRYDLRELAAFLAEAPDGTPVGAPAYLVEEGALEVVSIVADPPQGGAGSVLLAAAVDHARRAGLRRVWLVTTNDNLDAIRFYQRRGLRIAAVDPGAVDRSRLVKPEIPLVGAYGIPMHDELIMELKLDAGTR
jgi:GNAT superfamily N-acetyltransferase